MSESHGSRIEFLSLPLPPDDEVPSTGVLSLTLSTIRIETIPMWEGGRVIEVVNGMMSVKATAPETCRIGANAALERLADRENQFPGQISSWLRDRAKREKKGALSPVYVVDWNTLRPTGQDARQARPTFISVRQFAETMVGKRTGIRPSSEDSRVLAVLRNRVTVEEAGTKSEQEVPDMLASGVIGLKGSDTADDFLVFFLPTSDGLAAPMTLEDLILRERVVGGKKVAPFAKEGALTILDVLAPTHADRIRKEREGQLAREVEAAKSHEQSRTERAEKPAASGGKATTLGQALEAKGQTLGSTTSDESADSTKAAGKKPRPKAKERRKAEKNAAGKSDDASEQG